MSECMIERVATAMEQAMVNSSPDKAQCSRDMTTILARAAIEAMREPTEEMEAVIWQATSLAPEDVWPAMIRIALSTPDEK